MKNKITILVMLLWFGCGSVNKSDCIRVLIDITDSLKSVERIRGQQVTSLLHVATDDPLSGATVNIIPITELRFNKGYSISIPGIDFFSSNEITRQKEVETFVQKVHESLKTVKRLPIGRNGSLIVENIATQLNELSACKDCGSRRLIIISDIRQKSQWLNSYDTSQLNPLVRNPNLFYSLMNAHCPITGKLEGILIDIIHEPATPTEDEVFFQLSSLLKWHLEQKGAKVYIKTSI